MDDSARLSRFDDAPAPHYEAGDRVGGRYRIVSFIGRGGMGEIYRADDVVLGEPVALKFLRTPSPELVQELRSEVRLARQVSHPAICRIHDIGEADGRLFLSMEYVAGQDLQILLRRLGRLPPQKVLEMARELCDGLAEAHARGVTHRDLKPANVMLDADGRARILDFGIAVHAREGAARPGGTPAYMSPEQLRGEDATERSDLYELGLVLHEALTGERVFRAGSVGELLRMHERARVALPSRAVADVPAPLERTIMRALEEDPEKRPASAREMRELLDGGMPARRAVGPRAWIVPGLLLFVWVVCLGVHVGAGLSGRRNTVTDLLVQGAATERGFPVFDGFGRPPAAPTDLAAGDELTRVGRRDLRGQGAFWFQGVVASEVEPGSQLRVAYLRDGVPGTTRVALAEFPSPWWLLVPSILAWTLIPTWLLLRAPGDHRVRAMFYAGICPAIAHCFFGVGGFWWELVDRARYLVFGGILGVAFPLRFLCLLPDRSALPRHAGWLWVLGAAFAAAEGMVVFGETWSFRVLAFATPATVVAMVTTAGVIIVRRYQQSGPIGRRQLRWVLFGALAPFTIIALAFLVRGLDPDLYWVLGIAFATNVVTPVCYVIAVSRYNLFDIDRLISASLGYALLASAILVVGLVGIPPVIGPLAGTLGLPPVALAIPAAVLLLLLVLPFQSGVRRGIDRVLFHDRYEADVGIEDLLARLPELETIDEVHRLAGERLVEVFRPKSCAIHRLDGDAYVPIFATAAKSDAVFATQSPLVDLLERRKTALASTTASGARLAGELDAFERAALETLDADLIVPIREDDRLLGFLSLGRKSSGDVYTSVDRALLAALARVVAGEIASRSDRLATSSPTTRASAARSARSTDV